MGNNEITQSSDTGERKSQANGAPRTSLRNLSVDEAAAILGVSVSTVRRRIRDRSLPCLQLGGRGHRIVIPHEALIMPSRRERTGSDEPVEPAERSPDRMHQPERLRGPTPRWMQKK